MNELWLNQFAVLLWKNFTLNRRQFIILIVEISLTFLFSALILLDRHHTKKRFQEAIRYTPLSMNQLPDFLNNAKITYELVYVPSGNDVAKNLTEMVKTNLNYTFKVRGFASEKDFENYIKYENKSVHVLAAIVFDPDFTSSSDPLPLKVKYCLRFGRLSGLSKQSSRLTYSSRQKKWDTALLFPPLPSIGPRSANNTDGGHPEYIREGFLVVQHALDKAIMMYHNATATAGMFQNINLFVKRFPYPAYEHDEFVMSFMIILPVIVLLIFCLTEFTLIRTIVWEKENRLKEYQLMIGLSNAMLWAAYFVTFLVLYLIMICLVCVVLFAKIAYVPVLSYSSPSFFFVFFLYYVIAAIFFGFMISTFFDQTTLAVSVGGFLYFLTFFPQGIISNIYTQMSLIQKLASCLSLNIAMAMGIHFVSKMEMKRTGVNWNNLFEPVSPDDNFIFPHILGMLLFDAFLYGLVAWYVDAVFPGKYGVPKPWYFFVQRSYWFGEPSTLKTEDTQLNEVVKSDYFEAEPVGLVTGIQIKHLYKEFKLNNNTIVAIQDLNLNAYEGQITALLGQNGAGKTTTLSILSGFIVPTSGEVYINGYDISKDMVHIRKNLGLCPQNDLLFHNLTVAEHLYFYCVIKGVSQETYSTDMNRMLTAFNMQEKRDSFSQSLSGGMKRKLSIIIALIGGSKVVILDEPTSGMDPVSRRTTWDLLQQYKQDRTILLTTHYMDEADILGDRIAILVQGTLQCCGSSVFLKQIYGVGYHIVMVKEPNCDLEEITRIISYHIPGAVLENNVAAELSFILPREYTDRFQALFTDLENRQKSLGIASFGVSITTLEEVFLRVGQLAESKTNTEPIRPSSSKAPQTRQTKNENMNVPRNFERPDSSLAEEHSDTEFNNGCALYCQQFHAMLLKRAMFTWRNWNLVLLQILGLLGIVYLLLRGVNISGTTEEPTRQMDLDQYGQTTVLYSISGNSDVPEHLIKNLEIMLKDKQKLEKVQGDLEDYLQNDKCIYSCIVAFSIEVTGNRMNITFWFNNEAYHSTSLSLAILDNIIFKTLSGPDASITVSNKPQPQQTTIKKERRSLQGIQVALNLFFGMSILVSGFCLLTVYERTSKAKHIQFVSGVYAFNFWVSALLWDFAIFFISCCLLLVVFSISNLDIMIQDYHFLETMMILMLFGWSVIPFMYLMSFLFSSSTSAYIKLVLLNYCSGIFSILVDLILNSSKDIQSTTKTFVLNSFLLLPIYNLGMSISRYYDMLELRKLCSTTGNTHSYVDCNKEIYERNIFGLEDDAIGKFLIAMAVTGFVYFLLVFFLETTLWRLKCIVYRNIFFPIYKECNQDIVSTSLSGESEDEDVERERKRILEWRHELLNVIVILKELIKIYFTFPPVLAVRNISLAIQKRECFGLLGLNGAGKTTTFEILTGEETATSGDVFIDGYSTTKNIRKVRSQIGYCPQFDALLEHMTAREIMVMYARLWGIPEAKISSHVNHLLSSLNLEASADKLVYTYSGGVKRRLSTAVALMGKPSVIFLDEPSTGMDPVARRLLWNVVTRTRESGKVIIITSHSMDECDALCTRLAIMVKGKFVCLGSPQHLKNKFGNVYILKIKMKTGTDEDKIKNFKNFVENTFPGSAINQENQGIINYYIPSKDNSWGKMFGIMEKAKKQYDIEDYSISQITLEQVFLTFAKTGDESEKQMP
ncbi:ATP-binding cassette sub-family A member 3-like [Choloepus didactylus]|uniref:ATP-binding cassette sub-family A member 3-like n=1 Tax=Choloepus didactylus TaxID=27675 RepID=UPI00189DA432|nr:ATP-binding cassette sub-family A member 3-like [Choloepus didactylus]